MAVVVASPAAEPFERYQTVIDRKPFGPEPVNFDPEAAPGSAAANAAAGGGEMTAEQRTAEEQQLAASVRVSMINVTPSGSVAVGFTDSSVQPPENYYLTVGRSQDGWTVKSADPAAESVTLEKDGVDVTVKLGETSGGAAKKGRRDRSQGRLMTLQAGDTARGVPTGSEHASPSEGKSLGGLARLRKRRAELNARAQEDAAKKEEAAAVAAAEREKKEAQEEAEKRAREEREARAAEELAQQREALRQIQEQLRKDREAKKAAEQGEEEVSE